MEETLVSSWIDLNFFSIARDVSLQDLQICYGNLSFMEIGTRSREQK